MNSKSKRIEQKTSRTAQFTCVSRAASLFEKLPQYKSDDYIAYQLLPRFIQFLIKLGLIGNLYKKTKSSKGIYEYVIARTKLIDSIFNNAVVEKFDQILILGAGFDSRGIRLLDPSLNAKVFELDAPVTQNAKIKQFQKRKIAINPNIVFISIDFEKNSLEKKLIDAGFGKKKRSLFILEGLLMYLDTETVDSTFKIINEFGGMKSEIVFDCIYSSVLRKENIYYGEEGIVERLERANETWLFGIERGEIETFLKEYSFKLIRNYSSEELENMYFKDEKNNLVARVNGTHSITHAKK
ncbi:class I SAM-dependent methyltransferase [Bacteroidota bacterium]